MSKSHYLENIFADLKDEIAFDEDVVALAKLLKVMLKYDVKQSVNNWLYLMKNYNLKTLRQEIDFTPLTKEFIIELLRYQDLTQLFLNFKRIPNDNLNHILKEFMNVFNKESGIYQYFYGLIKEHKKQAVLFGIESHICVFQTAIELKEKGYEVYVVSDISFSRSDKEKEAALKNLRHFGILTLTLESVLFMWLETSKNPCFKEIQALIK